MLTGRDIGDADPPKLFGLLEYEIPAKLAATTSGAESHPSSPTSAQIDKFRASGAQVVLGFDHPEYGHMAALSDATRTALAQDFGA